MLHGCVFDGSAELVVVMVALAPVVAFASAVTLEKPEVGWTAPVKMVIDSEEVVCVGTEVCEAFAVASVLERRVLAPS